VALNTRLRSVLDWLREGYPAGVPATDYIPLLALLRRRLTEEEVREIAHEVAVLGPEAEDDPAEIGVRITKLTDALPSPEDVARVEQRLVSHHGWPLDDGDEGRGEDCGG
jgi:predicted HAD superfamily phosphohydrolase